MDRHQYDGAKVKAEDDELGIWVPVNQEPAESVPAVVPKDDPINRVSSPAFIRSSSNRYTAVSQSLR